MATIDTQVSRASPAVKQIIDATVGEDWPGKRVVVREVQPSWEHTEYIDDHTLAWYLNLATLAGTGQVRVWKPERPRYGGPAVVHPAPKDHEALVHVWRQGGSQGMEIIVLQSAIDAAAVSVATDILLAGGGKKAAAAAAQAASVCGANTGGLCLALAEANTKALRKGQGARELTPESSTREKKKSARLEREIQAALAHRR